jgi:hypothetical protein
LAGHSEVHVILRTNGKCMTNEHEQEGEKPKTI